MPETADQFDALKKHCLGLEDKVDRMQEAMKQAVHLLGGDDRTDLLNHMAESNRTRAELLRETIPIIEEWSKFVGHSINKEKTKSQTYSEELVTRIRKELE